MLDELLTQPHLLWAGPDPALNVLQQVLISPAGDAATFGASGALAPEAALNAGGGGVGPALPPLLGGLEAEGELFSGRAPIAVGLQTVAEILLAKETQLGVGGSVGFGEVGGDLCFDAGFDLLTVVVAHVREHIQPFDPEGLFGTEGHLAK